MQNCLIFNLITSTGDFAAETLPGNRIIVLGGESGEGKATNETAIRYVEVCVCV